jgi:hypothetical protein
MKQMVQRLNAEQTRQVIRDLVPQGLCHYAIPEPVSAARMEAVCTGMAKQSSGRAYGWFDKDLTPRAILVGLVMPDPFTGMKHGFEHLWWSAIPGKPALELLRTFEADCRKEGCTLITFGFSHYVAPEKTEKLYRRLGYRPYNTSMGKVI